MAMAKNPEYQGQDFPYDGILVPPSLNEGISIRMLPANADAATNVAFGTLVYFSQGTEKTDVTVCPVDFGDDDREAQMYLAVPYQRSGPLTFAYTTDAPHTPYLVPNTSITLSDYQLAAEEGFMVIPIVKGMKFWCLIGNDITADVIWNYTYFNIAGGMIGPSADPDGAALTRKVHAYKALASFTNLNWAFFEYVGKETMDDTA